MLARCHSPNITQYYASVLLPGSTELMIVMELMAASVFDVVSATSLSVRSAGPQLTGMLSMLKEVGGPGPRHARTASCVAPGRMVRKDIPDHLEG